MGGHIGCRSEPGKGSTFHFTVVLPVAESSGTTTTTTTTAATAATASVEPTTVDAREQPAATQEPTTTAAAAEAPQSPAGSAPGSPVSPTRPQTTGSLRSSTFIPSPLTVAPAKSPIAESSLHGVRVLLVEDNLVNQKVGVRMLASLGCSVQVAVDGQECLRILAAADRDDDDTDDRGFDAVLMDCQMPVMDGFQATQHIRERELKLTPTRRPLPVIALTASATKEYREQCFLSGMNDWLAKPFTKANLAQMLRKWVRPTHDTNNTGGANNNNNAASDLAANAITCT
jgi:CheY-like chemotaxis protein